MRLVFLLVLSYWIASPARAQKLPVVTDTATLNFMRWYWSQQNTGYKLYYLTTAWRDAPVGVSDSNNTFSHRLLSIHQANTAAYTLSELRHYHKSQSLPKDFFTQADLKTMRQHYEREVPTQWPAHLAKLTRRRPRLHRVMRCILPLFSQNGRRAVLWEYNGNNLSTALRAYERTTIGWQLVRTLGGDME